MSDFVENLKYSSNKITQILCDELENKGIKNYKPSLELVQGFGPYSPKEISNMQKEQRNILNARIAILERLSKEFETNEAFKGENGDEDGFYAPFVEFGHGGPHGPAAPHPFLQPAFDAEREEANRIIKEKLSRALDKVIK